jgi:phosphoglycolate phosphatase
MRACFFDLDGTLTDSRDGLFRCFRAGIAALGLEAPDDARLGTFLGAPLPRLFRGLDPGVTEAGIERGIAAFRDEYAVCGVAANRLYDGAAEMLEAVARAGAACWIVTSKPQPFALQVTAYLGLDSRLDGIVGAGLAETDLKADLLARALGLAGVPAEGAIMLGDRDDDAIAARANGVRAVGARWGYAAEGELERAGCTEFADSPRDFTARYLR